MKQAVVKEVFSDINQYMKNGTILRQVINEIDKIKCETAKEKNLLSGIYEKILKELQSAGYAGEFYTPRAVTDFIIERLAPTFNETVADFACSTGGFLTSTLNYLERKGINSAAQREHFANKSIYGIEKKPLPYLLAITNMLIHDLDTPQIFQGNSLERNINDYTEDDEFSVIAINPPYGGNELDNIRNNFPEDLRGSETADLFIALILYRLKYEGRAAVIIPDGFLFDADGPKLEIKNRLLNQFNLHTVIRLPASIFAPYTSITTNILFFNKGTKSKGVWFYRVDMPGGYKHFSKTKPMLLEHFAECVEWWNNRREIKDVDTDTFKAKFFGVDELIARNYDFDLCGYPNDDEEILSPLDTIANFKRRRADLSANFDEKLAKIAAMLEVK